MNVKRSLIRLYQLGRQFGIDPRRFLSALGAIPAFVRDYRRFRRIYDGKISFNPQLHDREAEGGVTKSEYFWQDLMVARWINEAAPEKHVDVGSRIDGFVAHVASFREIEVFDVRPLSTQIPNITFTQGNLMAPESAEPVIAGGNTAIRCPISTYWSISASAVMATQWVRKATSAASRVLDAFTSPGAVTISRHQSDRSASNSIRTGSSVQPPSSGWLTYRGYCWSGSRCSAHARAYASSVTPSAAKHSAHSQASTITSVFSSLRNLRSAQASYHVVLPGNVWRDWRRRARPQRPFLLATHCFIAAGVRS